MLELKIHEDPNPRTKTIELLSEHKWLDAPTSCVTRKWGDRPVLGSFYDVEIKSWKYFGVGKIDQMVREHSVIYLSVHLLPCEIETLRDSLRRLGEPRIIVSMQALPGEWPDSVRLIVTHPMAYIFSYCLDKGGFGIQHKKKVRDLKYNFGIMQQGPEPGRRHLIMMLKKLGLLDRALYSNNHLTADHTFSSDELAINKHLVDIPSKIIGVSYDRKNLFENMKFLLPEIEKCHLWISTESDVYMSDLLMCVAEKPMWAVSTGTPLLAIWRENVAQQMRDWGYRFHNLGIKGEDETDQGAVRRWCEKIAFMDHLFRDPDWAQDWLDLQGENTSWNAELSRKLHLTIAGDTERQIQELPAEFQNLQ